ncbi:MAG: hypothetical protein ABH828_02895 [archaeon]
MEEVLLMEEEQEIRRIKSANHKKDIQDLNRKSLSNEDMDEIFCEY